MVNARYAYLRPGNLFKDFIIESDEEVLGANGRPKARYDKEGERTLHGCLADATEQDRERWKQLQHPITHTVVQAGRPRAKEEDRLVLGERVFIIRKIDDCGSLGVTTIYYAEERTDAR